ncbi:hypothetical protein RHSIM_Rhsim07G0174500 [Rhododendron simsii]|uniref:Protein kinase domain-containing protein n=1 Tax=Rhododendron simsii TaxID=118357 RepID=A0A834GQ92_RHOSS|nr:hypothetical protein RHSIM_Rhsim07G0174500 [Rhododendron simsii]
MGILFLLFASLCICISLHSLLNLFRTKLKLPPSPPTIPFLGNLLWLLKSSQDFSHLEPVLRRLRAKYGPIVTLHIGSRPAIFITSHGAAHRALVQNAAVFASRPPALEATKIFFSNQHTVSSAAYGPLWRVLRQNLASFLHPSKLHLFANGRKWAYRVLREKLRAEAESAKGKAILVQDHFQHAVFCLLVYICFGEKLEETAVREIEAAQRPILTNFIRFNVLNFMPRLGKIVFRKLWRELFEIRRNQENVILPLIRQRQERMNNKKIENHQGDTPDPRTKKTHQEDTPDPRTKKTHQEDVENIVPYVDTLFEIRLPEENGGRKFTDGEMGGLSCISLRWLSLTAHSEMTVCATIGSFPMNCQRPLILCVLVLSVVMDNTRALSLDGDALISFRTAILSSDGVLLQWRPEDPDPCGWKGVQCDPKTQRVISLSLPFHRLIGPISPDIGRLEHLQFLALHNNNFFGTIPPELGNCTELRALSMQGNYLSGPIPSALGNLSVLENLDISSNSLSGSIPESLGKLYKLINLNVSNNFLRGPIPSDGVLENFTESSFLGNLGLCGKQVNKRCDDAGGPSTDPQTPSSENQGGKKKYSGRLLVSTSATVGALLLVALMCFWGCFLYKRLGKKDGRGLAMDVGGGASIVMFHGDLPYSSKDIIKKLETLNEEHIIGSGGFGTVYRLAMEDGNIFALKKIIKMNDGFDRFFERELEILGSIKHRYLVNLRGYCNSSTSKLLIYDFLSNGSLDEALHEYMQSGRATEKTDVYSFGVLMLEVVCGKRPTDASFIEKGFNIVGWLNFLVSENRQREIVDPNCEGVQEESLDALLSVAIQCVSSTPEDRPTMNRVFQILESEVMTPCPSDFYDSNSD